MSNGSLPSPPGLLHPWSADLPERERKPVVLEELLLRLPAWPSWNLNSSSTLVLEVEKFSCKSLSQCKNAAKYISCSPMYRKTTLQFSGKSHCFSLVKSPSNHPYTSLMASSPILQRLHHFLLRLPNVGCDGISLTSLDISEGITLCHHACLKSGLQGK